MTTYTIIVRVELHKDDARTQPHPSSATEYQTLHEEMHSRGFFRFYKTKGGDLSKLPPGEYRLWHTSDEDDEARSVALNKAIEAATIATTAKRFSLLVSGGDSITGYQLEKITKDPDA